ncbi:MAG TPA: hypothetical protein VMZ29_16210 [Candidatus Bathyarchaeia archaeon]|nr:hypothetical protein [Candidatus Bathyarchaeia archaeon]
MKRIDKSEKKKAAETIEKTLWNVAKKYKTFEDKETVPQVKESEEDRKQVANAYLELTTKRHRQLDARVYGSLSKMQKTRDTKIALEGTTERDRLRMIAWEVKIRTQAIISLPGDSTLEMDIFRMHDGNSVRILDGEEREISVEDIIIEDKGIAILESLPLRKLTAEQKTKLKDEFVRNFSGKKYSIKELEETLDNVNADLLSLLIREKRIILRKITSNQVEILNRSENSDEDDDSYYTSQSIVISPKKGLK